MAEFIKVELAGTVTQAPFYTTGFKKDGTPYELGSINVKADYQFIRCAGFGTTAEFIKNLSIGDPVYIVGHQKANKGKDGKWYPQVDISFIAGMNTLIQPQSKNKEQINSPYDLMPPAEEKPKVDNANEEQYFIKDDDLPF